MAAARPATSRTDTPRIILCVSTLSTLTSQRLRLIPKYLWYVRVFERVNQRPGRPRRAPSHDQQPARLSDNDATSLVSSTPANRAGPRRTTSRQKRTTVPRAVEMTPRHGRSKGGTDRLSLY